MKAREIQLVVEKHFFDHVASGLPCSIVLKDGTAHTRWIIRRIQELAPDDYVIVYKHEVNTPEGEAKYNTGRVIVALI